MDNTIKLYVAKLTKDDSCTYRVSDNTSSMSEIIATSLEYGYSAVIESVDFDLSSEKFASFVWDNYVALNAAPSSVSEEAQAQE